MKLKRKVKNSRLPIGGRSVPRVRRLNQRKCAHP